jgi:mannose-1-phosphate guanylyltransferase/phosphomannomutase
MKAVVMAGGFGTRIQPLTNSRPKPMLPIMNKPMMEHTMMMLKDLGVTEFIVLLYFKPEIIQNYFGDGSAFGIKVTYIVPDDDYGTAGAVKLAQEAIGDDNFIIISGDLVTDFDFAKLFDFHKAKESQLSIGLTSVENPLQFGVVITNEDEVIEKFLEKPSWGEVFSDTINTGIYIIEPEILNYIPENENFDFAKDLFPLLMEKNIALMGHSLSGYWRDVGNPESYRDVYEDILNGSVDFNIGGYKKKYPDGVLYSSVEYDLDASIEIVGQVVLDENVTIKKGVKLNNVIIGKNVSIGANSKIRNSVFWENITTGNNVKLDSCIICNDNKIHKNVTAKAGLILAEGCEVGELASFESDVIIWPDKYIEAASIVSNNLILGSRYKNSIFENGSVFGKSNVELSCEMATKLAEAFAAQLPVGSRVIVGRDEDKSSRMLKRAFLGGLLSAGIDVTDIKDAPPSVLRYTLANDSTLSGGAHIKRCTVDTVSTEITLFNEEAIRVDNESSKKIEKSFFTEQFRRVEYSKIGNIHEVVNRAECIAYRNAITKSIDHSIIKCGGFKVAVDLMHGTTSEIVPPLLNFLGIENIILNAYYDEKKLTNIKSLEKKSESNISSIVKSLNYDMGLLIYPNAQKVNLVTEEGEILDKVKALYTVLSLVNIGATEKKKKVFLPTWAPDIKYFENLDIKRGKYANFKASQLVKYDLVATVDGNYSFGEFGYTRDAIYSSIKIMELLSCHEVKLSTLSQSIDKFYYKTFKIDCAQSLKGKMMRKFLQSAKGKKSSSIDGVKIWEDEHDWILMIPDQYSEHLNIYIQAVDDVRGDAIHEKYSAKITHWSNL